MKKTAVIYDKWLNSLGGGEVVACRMARILQDYGYEVTFINGKSVEIKAIKDVLGIDMSDITFTSIWNDEVSLKAIAKNKDLFVNLSFIDYSYGYSKKNIYYTHFPTKNYNNLLGYIELNIICPLLAKYIKQIEFIKEPNITTIINKRLAYLLQDTVQMAFSFLPINKIYRLKFSIFFETFSSSLINKFNWKILNSQIIDKKITIDHHHNVIHFFIDIKPKTQTIYLILNLKDNFQERIYLLNPRIFPMFPKIDYFMKKIYEKVNNKLRTGIFIDAKKRIESYQLICANSEFTKKYIYNYLGKDSVVLYPPVRIPNQKRMVESKKERRIVSVGRFFTLGHGKKQEILIKAFKKIYNLGFTDWRLDLIGGVDVDYISKKLIQYLEKRAKGYPIYFHYNLKRKKVEEILFKSTIYWHATGFGENEKTNPVKFEHFGIAPIEAISARCIPILFKGGGLKEIIDIMPFSDKNDYLFSTVDELVNKTIAQINNPVGQIDWDKVNSVLEENFSTEVFKKRFLKLIK